MKLEGGGLQQERLESLPPSFFLNEKVAFFLSGNGCCAGGAEHKMAAPRVPWTDPSTGQQTCVCRVACPVFQ